MSCPQTLGKFGLTGVRRQSRLNFPGNLVPYGILFYFVEASNRYC